jgi:rhodanese-related sulfurtransferase
MSELSTISARRLSEMQCKRPVTLIDVRTPAEFREVHAVDAQNVPLDTLDPTSLLAESQASGEPLYLICQAGTRGTIACRKLIEAGCKNVVNVEGGTQAWEAAGLPVVRGRKAISLERQVRIAAGSIVVVGSLLGYFVHPYFAGIAAFVGAGLVFAGITNTCGMGMLLAKMPWNRCST